MLSPTRAAVDHARMVRLRKLQRLINADLNAIASHASDAADRPLTTDQWTDLWRQLEAASAALQRLTKELAAAGLEATAERRRRGSDRRFRADRKRAS